MRAVRERSWGGVGVGEVLGSLGLERGEWSTECRLPRMQSKAATNQCDAPHTMKPPKPSCGLRLELLLYAVLASKLIYLIRRCGKNQYMPACSHYSHVCPRSGGHTIMQPCRLVSSQSRSLAVSYIFTSFSSCASVSTTDSAAVITMAASPLPMKRLPGSSVVERSSNSGTASPDVFDYSISRVTEKYRGTAADRQDMSVLGRTHTSQTR